LVFVLVCFSCHCVIRGKKGVFEIILKKEVPDAYNRQQNATIMATETEEFIPTRRTLLGRLKDWQDQQSWREFFDVYGRLIYGVARKAELTDAEAQDVVQETVVSVAKAMPTFHYDPALGSFKGWLLQVTRSRINDAWRKKYYRKNGQTLPREERLGTTILEGQAGPVELDNIWNAEWEKSVLQVAMDRIKGRVEPSRYQMFYLHVVKKIPAREVARRLCVKLAEVYFAKYRVSALIKKEIGVLESKGM
jgi:RNA polymerase sigma factor (sigma-70 family)